MPFIRLILQESGTFSIRVNRIFCVKNRKWYFKNKFFIVISKYSLLYQMPSFNCKAQKVSCWHEDRHADPQCTPRLRLCSRSVVKGHCWAAGELYFSVRVSVSLFFNLFLFFRGEERKKAMERYINVWLSLMCPLLGTWPATQAHALTGNQTSNPLILRPAPIHWATPARAWESF